jgi:hypothetical protein
MSEYVHPSRDTLFVLDKIIGFDALCDKVGADVSSELAAAIIEEAGKLGAQVLGPLNSVGDRNGALLTEKGVEQTAGFAEAYRLFCEGGWCALTSPSAFFHPPRVQIPPHR